MNVNTAKIVMAVDPFVPELKPTRQSAAELRHWLVQTGSKLELVYVVAPPGADQYIEPNTLSEKLLQEYVELIDAPDVVTKLLYAKSPSKRDSVKALTEYARSQKAKFIVLTSYGRHLVGRLMMGGFADAVVSGSSVPVLVLGSKPGASSHRWGHSALYATDFSAASFRGFQKFLDQFSGVVKDVIVFNVAVAPVDYSAMGMMTIPQNYWQEQLQFVHAEGERWVKYARLQGFEARYVVDSQSLDIVTAIHKFAEDSRVGLIGLTSVSEGSRARVLESISSKLFYFRSFPVWVNGPSADDSIKVVQDDSNNQATL